MNEASNSKGKKILKYVLLLVLLLALVGAVVALAMERTRMKDLDQLNEELQMQIQQLQDDTDSDQPTTPETTRYESEKGVAVTIYTPESEAEVTSPLGVVGKVPGTWSFEADFPVLLLDGNGKTIAQAPAQIQGDWMTENDVPFSVTLTFEKSTTATGTLILQKSNPSGLEGDEDSVSIPVQFR